MTSPDAGDAGLYYVVITTAFGTLRNYVATLEVKIPFSLVGLPGRLADGIFDLQLSGTPQEPYAMQSTPDPFGWIDVVVGTLPGYTITLSDTNAGANPVRFCRVSSTLVINPGKDADQDPKAFARILRFDSKPKNGFAIADLTPAFAKHARRAWRGLALLDRKQVLIQDEVKAEKAAEVWWFMHTKVKVHVTDEKASAILSEGSGRLWVKILSPANTTFDVMDARPLPTSPNPLEQAKNEGARKLVIHLSGVKEARLAVLASGGGTNLQALLRDGGALAIDRALGDGHRAHAAAEGSPTVSAAMRSVNSRSNRSAIGSATMNLFAAMQDCPLFTVRA